MEVVIGQPFTFAVLFVDAVNQPMAVNNPVITIFGFSGTGVKQTLVNRAAMSPATPAEVGRYTYVYTIPTTYTDGAALYGEMEGTELGTGLLLRADQALILISSNRGLGGSPGLIARFV